MWSLVAYGSSMTVAGPTGLGWSHLRGPRDSGTEGREGGLRSRSPTVVLLIATEFTQFLELREMILFKAMKNQERGKGEPMTPSKQQLP